MLLLLLLTGVVSIALRFPAVQNFVVQRVTGILSNQLGTSVRVGYFQWDVFRNIRLSDVYIADKKNDTLLYVKTLGADIAYWSLLKKQVNIDRVMMEGAFIRLKQDAAGQLNLTELFSTGNNGPEKSKGEPFQGIVNLKECNFKDTRFLFDDEKGHGKYLVELSNLHISVNELGLNKKWINLKDVDLSGLAVNIQLAQRPINHDSIPEVHFLKNGWKITWDRLNLGNASFQLDDANKLPIAGGIDFGHLKIGQIALGAQHGRMEADTIFTDIGHLHASEKSGFELKELRTALRVATNGIELDSLNLETPNSKIGHRLAMYFNNFTDFGDFMNAVRLEANFHQSKLALKDLNFFIRQVKPVAHNTVFINGKISGRINNLQARDVLISTGVGTRLKGDFYTRGLPNLQETSINLRIEELASNVYDIRQFYPGATLPPNFNTLGNIRFTGDFDGFVSDFVTRGRLTTSIGSATTDLNFKYNKQLGKSAYSGNLALQQFDLGTWFGDAQNLGKVSLTTVVKGGGLKLETLAANLTGDVQEITLKGHTYKDLKVDGVVKGKSFTGDMKVRDEFLDMDFSGLVDLGKEIPEFRFNAEVRKAELRELNLLKDTFSIKGKLVADFRGKRVDDLVGNLRLNDVQLRRGSYVTHVDQAVLSSTITGNQEKWIQLKTEQAEGEVKGRFSYADLPKVFRNYINHTFTRNFEEKVKVPPQQFTFNLKIYDSTGLARIVLPKLYSIRNSVIRGNVNSERQEFNVQLSVPEVIYDKYQLRRLDMNAISAEGKIDVTATADKVLINDSLAMDTLVAKAVSVGDDFRFNLIAADKTFYNRANITANLIRQNGSADIHFEPSEVWLGRNKWTFRKGNTINIKGKRITSDGLFFESGEQSIQVDAFLKNDTSTSVKLQLTQTSLADFLGIFNKSSRDLKGTVNGTAVIEDVLTKPAILADLEASKLTLGNELLGNLKVRSQLDESLKRVNLQLTLASDKNDISAGGSYGISNNDLDVDVHLGALGIGFLNYPFFIKYVKNCSGKVRGNIHVGGTAKAPVLQGRVTVDTANVTVSFLNTTYSLQDEDITLRDGVIDIGQVTVYDRFGNTAQGYGKITHDHFRKFTFDLHVNTQNAEFLNTNAKLQPNFYGNAFGRGKVDFIGTLPNIEIRAAARVAPGTHCYIPVTSTYETNRYAFYRFVNPAKDSLAKQAKQTFTVPTGVNFILDLDVTPDGIIDIQLDPAAGDVLSSSGRGNLKIELLRTGEFNIYGLYEIDNGNYLFTLQNIINKRFLLEKGGTIKFTGDIYHAQLNADATYNVRTAVYDLISDQITTDASGSTGNSLSNSLSDRAKNRVLVKLLLKLQGVLQSPEVGFDIRVQDLDPLIRNYVESKMQLVKSADAEMNKQVFGLLVMNRFLPTNNSLFGNPAGDSRASTGNLVGGGVTNTVSEFLSSQLSHYVSNLFDNLNVHDLDFNFNFRQYDQTSNITNSPNTNSGLFDTRRELQLALTKRFLNNRLLVSAGGNLDFGDNRYYDQSSSSYQNKTNANITGDFQIEYVLDKNGVWRAKAFNRGEYDNFYQKNRNRTGVGIGFRQDFDNLRDLFRRKRKPKVDQRPPSEGDKPKEPVVVP